MSSRLGSLLYAAALVVVFGAGCAVPRAVPTVLATSTVSVSEGATSPGIPTGSTLPAEPTSAAGSPSVPRTTTATSTAVVSSSPTRATTSAAQGCGLPAALLGMDLTLVPGAAKVVALTFDAGANADGVPSILATLAGRQVPGTFFLTGAFVDAFPAASQKIAAAYPIGNHTQNHKDLTKLTTDGVKVEIRTGAASIHRVTGVDPRPYFRFPYGAVDARTIATVNAKCYVPFRWTVDSWGWKGTAGGMSADEVQRRVVGALRPGAIVLMHVGSNPDDGTTFDANALPRIVDEIRAQGYTLVTLEQVLSATP
ncbi:MAG TPA: polysaccharide deacetylase family protein [Pengzhenrongella sp.]